MEALKCNVQTINENNQKVVVDYSAAIQELPELRQEFSKVSSNYERTEKEKEKLHSENELLAGQVTELGE